MAQQSLAPGKPGSDSGPEEGDRQPITAEDIWRLREGTHDRLYQLFGAHPAPGGGARFAVWAPAARSVAVIGEFNDWRPDADPLHPRENGSGIWEGEVAAARHGDCYKYRIVSERDGLTADQGDPFSFWWEAPPGDASRVWLADHPWDDEAWMRQREGKQVPDAPLSIYEVHLGSWRRVLENGGERFLTYREAAAALADYVHHMGFTHVELLPVMEHADYGSWGYQVTGLFAPSARYGPPEDLMALMDCLHRRGIGVILDWVPSCPPGILGSLAPVADAGREELAEPPQAGEALGDGGEVGTQAPCYAQPQARAFLLSSALFWLERFHADGLRLAGVTSMLFPGSARHRGRPGTDPDGGAEPQALRFLRALNEAVAREYPGTLTMAEESSGWPRVTRSPADGGLGFALKWNAGWMEDTLGYLAEDPLYRKHHHERLTASLWYAFSERFLLPLHHGRVAPGKGSLVARMPGDDWQKQANLRLLMGWLFAHPGKKLVFMGDEIGQWREWAPERSLDWHLLDFPGHQGLQAWVRDLNHLYRQAPALYQQDFAEDGFAWIEANDAERSVVAFARRGRSPDDLMLVVCNFTPVVRHNYRLGVPRAGWWQEVLNGDARGYGGSGQGNLGGLEADPVASHGQFQSLSLTLPPLAVIFLQYQGEGHAEQPR